MRPPRHLITSAAAVTALSAAALAFTLGTAGCAPESNGAMNLSTIQTPGVYINSIGSFTTDLLASVREANPACR